VFRRSAWHGSATRELSTFSGTGLTRSRVFASVLLAVQLCACSSDSASTPSGTSGSGGASVENTPAYERLACDVPAVIEYCGGATCHYDNASLSVGSSLALWDRDNQQIVSDVESRLLNVPATYHNVVDRETCPSEPELLVDASRPEESLILKKLQGTQSCGDEMPKFPYPEWGATNNPGAEREEFVACISAWVTLLAQEYNSRP
jgi:hypothetical protein